MALVYAVGHVASKSLITVDVETSAQDAINMMVEKNIGALVVTERAKPVGIVTERDILKNCCKNAICEKTKIKEIMSTPLVTVDTETPIGKAIEVMIGKNVRRLLVSKGEKIVGIATHRDLMKGTLQAFHALSSTIAQP